MECEGIEITLNGHQICIPRYWQKSPLVPIPIPDPDPNLRNPFHQAFDDIAVLATIADGLSRIHNEQVRTTLKDAVLDGFNAVDLPKGMRVGAGVLAGLAKF